MPDRWSLLLITDLHYEQPKANYIDDNKELRWPEFRDDIFANFNRILKDGFGSQKFDVIAICGDITTHGASAGFDRFFREAVFQLRALVQRSEAICIVPGNHDVKWGLSPTDGGSFDVKFDPFLNLVGQMGATSCLYPKGELTGRPNERLRLRYPAHGPIYRDSQRKVLVTCINSSIRCGELNTVMQDQVETPVRKALEALKTTNVPGIAEALSTLLEKDLPKYLIRDVAHVTQTQLNTLADKLTEVQRDLEKEWNSYLRVAILHHHLIHFPNQITEHRGYELLVDSAQVLSLLADFDFDLILTGHKHQPYKQHYSVGRREMLLIGGPTVGGYAAGDSFRGLRWIDVEDRGDYRSYKISDLSQGFGEGHVSKNIAACRATAPEVPSKRSPEAGLEERTKQVGFSYREIASMTLIDEDGDAHRVIEYEDLRIANSESDRASRQKIQLPSTSGYLKHLRAYGKGFTIDIKSPLPREQRVKIWESTLEFDQAVGRTTPASYSYDWYAFNSFALNKLQFDYMYGQPGRLNNVEFTHFTTEDPAQELAVVVRFPRGFRLQKAPVLRIARVDPAVPDAREWDLVSEVKDDLTASHALRYYESLNIAALRVKYPRPDLSYGIQWEVPDAPAGDEDDQLKIRELRERLKSTRPDAAYREGLLRILARIIIATRRSFLSTRSMEAWQAGKEQWQGPIDGSLMYFDGNRELPLLVAAVEEKTSNGEYETKELLYKASLRYGDGIGGRAFKTNRLRVYVSPQQSVGDDELDYYVHLPGGPKHMVLVSLPVHIPAAAQEIVGNPRLYESKLPYAVINLGSERADCPLSSLRLSERIPHALRFQHEVNVFIYQELRKTLFHE